MDWVIRGGRVVDGLGTPAFTADVGISSGKVVEIGRITERGLREVRADGAVVAPGFIDPHTHYDAQVTWDPYASCSPLHGVTTVAMGNCGFGVAPCRAADRDALMRLLVRVEGMDLPCLKQGIRWNFETFGEYLAALDGGGLRLNVAAFVGHSALRLHVMGEAAWEREANRDELALMANLVKEAVDAGALGLSTSIHKSHVGETGRPVPSRLAAFEEFVSLGRAVRHRGTGLLQVGVDTSVDTDRLDWVARLARESGAPVTFGAVRYDPSDPTRHERALAQVDALCRDGLSLHPQVTNWKLKIEFTALTSTVFARLPGWRRALTTDITEWPALFRDAKFRATIGEQLRQGGRAAVVWSPEDSLRVRMVSNPALEPLIGQSLFDIGRAKGADPLDILFGLLVEDPRMEFTCVLMNTDEAALERILQHPRALLALSDAGAHATLMCEAGQTSHFLAHWVRNRKAFSLEEGVRRLTSMPAEVLGLSDRGKLGVGLPADVVIFDPDQILALEPELVRDLPGGRMRFIQRARGIGWTFVNGQPLIQDGAITANVDAPHGVVLRPVVPSRAKAAG